MICLYPSITSLNFRKRDPWSSFVKNLPPFCLRGNVLILFSLFRAYLLSRNICDSCALFLHCMTVFHLVQFSLSWCKVFSLSVKPSASKNILTHIIFGIKSLTPTISSSVELLVLSFYFWHFVAKTPRPKEIHPPV